MAGGLKVLIAGYYGFKNAGDEAILRAIIIDLQALHPEIRITVLSGDPSETKETHSTAAISWKDSLAILNAVSEADLTIVGGGGLFHDYWGFNPNLFLTNQHSGIAFYTAPAVLAALLGKPLILYAIGVGPLLSGHAKRFTRVACEAAAAITVRDEGSKLLLESIGVSGNRVTVTADPVFGLMVEDRRPLHESLPEIDADFKKPLVAVSVRDWDVGVESSFWEREFAAGLDQFLANEGGTVLFVPFGKSPGKRENDHDVSLRIQSHMGRRGRSIVISRDFRSAELLHLFGHCDLTVGMRLHALIFSALNHVPFVAVSYDPKVDWFMETIGSPNVIDIKSLEADILARNMSKALAGAAGFHARIPDKLGKLAILAKQNAEIALSSLSGDHRLAHPPSPELSSLIVRGIRAQLLAGDSLRSELRDLGDILKKVEADRDEGRNFLSGENKILLRRFEETSLALSQLHAENHTLRTELERGNLFQQSQNDVITKIEQDRLTQREELGKFRQRQLVDEQTVAQAEACRDRLREELGTQRQLQLLALSQLHAANDTLRAELERGSLFRQSQIDVITKIEQDRLALQEELEKFRQRQLVDERTVAQAEAGRDRLREELDTQRQLQQAREELLTKETSLALSQLHAENDTLRTELERGKLSQQSQSDVITRIEQDRLALREELEKSRQRQRVDEQAVAQAEAGCDRLREELDTQRQLQRRREELLTRLEAEGSIRAREVRDSVARAILLETDRESISSQLRSTQQQLSQRAEALNAERHAREAAEDQFGTCMASLRRSRLKYQDAMKAIQDYRTHFEYELGVFRRQRAWRVMLYFRRAYTLLFRHGWRGWFRFGRWTLTIPFKESALHEDDLQFPDIARYIPAADFASTAAPSKEEYFSKATRPASLGSGHWNKYDIIILGIIDFDFRFQRPQQIAAQFARTGHRVFWISPTRFLPPTSERAYDVTLLRENIWEIHLRGPQPDVYLGRLDPAVAHMLAASLQAFFIDQALAENLLMLQLPFWRQVGLALRDTFGSVLAYDCMDDWETFSNMGQFNVLEEKSLAAECDILTVSGGALEDKFKAAGVDSVLVRNASDFKFFFGAQSTNLLAGIPRPIIGYFGAIADWIDLDLVREVATMRAQYSFVLIGQVFDRDVSTLECLPNVYLLGDQRYELIPSFLADFDACTIPFLLNQVTRATDPVKIYEYFSQGKPVIATDMPELSRCGDLTYIGKGPEDFASKVDAALAENGTGLRDRRIDFARKNTWESRVQTIDARVQRGFPLVSILIVTFNSAEFVLPCLESIRDCTAYPAYEIIIVDNNSSDETVDIVRNYAATNRNIQIEALATNMGFSHGNNLAARKATGDYLILLNIDTMVTSGWIGRMMEHIRRDPSIGVICPVTNFAGNEAKINVDYTNPSEMRQFALKLAAENRWKTLDVEVAPLYCALIPRKVWIQTGELDEGFGLGMYEDDDFSLRVRQAGYRVVAAEDCFVHHFGQGSFSKIPPETYRLIFEANRKRFEDKWKVTWKPHRTRLHVRPAFEEQRFAPKDFCSPGKR